MNISIIGSNAFLAYYIVRKLKETGCRLNLFGTRPEEEQPELTRFFYFRLPEYPANAEALLESDTIIYTAAAGVQAGIPAPASQQYMVNTHYPIQLANFLEENNYSGNYITFGSYHEIGNNSMHHFFTEEEMATVSFALPNHYCSSKRLLTRFISNGTSSVRHFHLILPTIYGKGENDRRLIPYIIHALEKNAPLQLTTGNQLRQYLHASDVADFVERIVEGEVEKGLYNLCGRDAVYIKDIVTLIFSMFGRDPANALGKLNRSDESMKVLLINNGKACKTGWVPRIALEEGIAQYLPKLVPVSMLE